jgi:isopentenyl-diphosphate delta-isomerase
MEDENELLDLIDENDKVIGTVRRTEYYKEPVKPKGYLRSVELFIRNNKGQLWIPRRTAQKKVAPNGLDYSCGGHVTSGEDYVTALVREIKEELNMGISPNDLHFIKKFHPSTGYPWFRCLYLYESNEVPKYNREDFSEYYWLTPQQLLTKLKSGEPAKVSMLSAVREVLDVLSSQRL